MSETTPPPDEQNRLPFDQAITTLFRDAAAVAISRHPELRSVAVIVDYRGNLNEHNGINKAVWLGDNGEVNRLDAIFGSIRNTLMVLDVMMQRAVKLEENLRNQAMVLGAEMIKKQKELTEIHARITQASSAPAAQAPEPVAPVAGLGDSGTAKPESYVPAGYTPIKRWPDHIWVSDDGEAYNTASEDKQRYGTIDDENELTVAGYVKGEKFDNGYWWWRQPARPAAIEPPQADGAGGEPSGLVEPSQD